MTSTRDRWMRFLFAGLFIAAAPLGLPAAHAQGYSPDPFRPYNSQYDQYAYPTRPEMGPSVMGSRASARGNNQFQEYMNELQGASRESSQRYGIGSPYWRFRTDVKQDKLDRLKRRSTRKNGDVLGSITQQYLAYFAEDSPKKRAILLRGYDSSGNADDGDGAAGSGGVGEGDEKAPALDLGRRSRREPGGAVSGRPGATATLRRSAEMSEEKGGRTIPPPPPLRGISREPSRTQRRPSEVLERSRRLGDSLPDSGPPSTRNRREREQPKPSTPDE